MEPAKTLAARRAWEDLEPTLLILVEQGKIDFRHGHVVTRAHPGRAARTSKETG